MLYNRNILCISNPSWEGDYAKAIVELMKVFAINNKVLFVDNPSTFKDIIGAILHRKKFPYRRTFGLQKRIREFAQPGGSVVYVLTAPPVMPINFLPPGFLYDFLLRINGWLVTASIRRALRKLKMEEQLVNIVAFNPAIGTQAARKLNEKLLIYHCYDEINAANWLKKHGRTLEERLMKLCDATIVTSQGLLAKKSQIAGNCYLVKNGVDIDLFSSAFEAENKNQKKIIGYIGSIDDRLDINLLEHLIESLPEASFVFVGRVVDDSKVSVLRKYKNVSLVPPLPMIGLPAILKTFSLGIIPFVQNEFTKGIYPLKINEYLAAGLPVVSTRFSYLDDFECVIAIAESNEDFLNKVKCSLENDNAEKRFARLQLARTNSWKARVEEISDIIINLEQKVA